MQKISIKQICNLSRLPLPIKKNPCYQTVKQLLKGEIDYKQTALYEHYKKYRPETLADIYGIEQGELTKVPYDCIFLPWLHTQPVKKFEDRAYISREEGYAEKQIEKIRNLISSIQDNGYLPEKFIDRKGGYITGYFLENKEQKKFYIVSGNHRTSILAALYPRKKIPTRYEKFEFMKERDKINVDTELIKNFPPIFSTKNIESWPSVVSGFITASEAEQMIDKYFEE